MISWSSAIVVSVVVVIGAVVLGAFVGTMLFVLRFFQRQATAWHNIRLAARSNFWFGDQLSLRFWTILLLGYVVTANICGFGIHGALARDSAELLANNWLFAVVIVGGACEGLAYFGLLIAVFARHEAWPDRHFFRTLLARCTDLARCVICRATRRQQFCGQCGTNVP